MSKVAKIKTEVIGGKDVFTVTKTKTGETLVLAPKFIAVLKTDGEATGAIYQTLQERRKARLAVCMNLSAAFNEYKRITEGNGFPAFVADYIDKECPRSYGKVGSDERRKLTTRALFVGLEAMNKDGQAAIKAMAARAKLIAAGVNVDNAEEVAANAKETREENADNFASEFSRSIVGFERHGVTDVTVSNLLLCMGKHKKGEKDSLTKLGETLRDKAIKAVFAIRERQERNVTPEKKAK